MGRVFRVAMFITSFMPLWLTIIIKNLAALFEGTAVDETVAVTVMVALGVIYLAASCVMWKKLRAIQCRNPETVHLLYAAREKTLTTEYLLAYILPLFVFDFTNIWELSQFLVYFLVLAYLCIRNGNVYANIALECRGYRCYSCRVFFYSARTDGEITVLSRARLDGMTDCELKLDTLNKPVYLDRT